jgi:hypothetical protein
MGQHTRQYVVTRVSVGMGFILTLTVVNRCLIPEEHEVAGLLTPQTLQEGTNICGVDRLSLTVGNTMSPRVTER